MKKVLIGAGTVVGLLVLGGGGFVWSQTSAYDSNMERVYDVPLPQLTASSDPAVIARGEHLSKSFAGCAAGDCHGPDLAGGKPIVMGPVGTLVGPNITAGGLGVAYSDAELARLLTAGVKKDGRSVRFMPVQELNWLPDSDILAIISYLRTVPAVEKPNGASHVGLLGKILDNNDKITIDVARRIVGKPREHAPAPEPTAAYGRFVSMSCMGCHGETFGGGPIPGAPSDLPIPSNITPDVSGIKDWTYDDFTRLLDTGTKKNGEQLDAFMPLDGLAQMSELERKAVWAFLQSLPPKPMGSR